MRMIPALVVPFRMIRTEYFVLLTLPAIASFNAMVLVESNRLNLLRLWLRAEVCALRFDLLHMLRSRLVHGALSLSLHVLLASCRSRRSSAAFSRGLLHTCTLLALFSLLLPAFRLRSRLTPGNIRSRRWSICRFLVSPSLPAFSSTRLSGRFTGRFSGGVRFSSVRRL